MIIGVVAAMGNELRPFLQKYPISKVVEIAHQTFYISKTVSNQKIIAVCSGRGKVNATMYTQLLITHFTPDILINVGGSGGVAEESDIGDLYIGTEYCHYDVRKKQSQYTFPKMLYYPGDPVVVTIVNQNFPNIKNGIFGTGEGFVTDKMMKKHLIDDFSICAVDMESAAIAQCCYLNETRYISLRGICDKANREAIYTTEEVQEIIARNIYEVIESLTAYL